MELINKTEKLNQLYFVYGPILTKKQQSYFKLCYYENYSLQEIADYLKVSKNAVYDQLNSVEKKLLNYEKKLKIAANLKKRRQLLEKYFKDKDEKYLNELRKMDE